MTDLSDLALVHVIGIGGSGMSAIARVLHQSDVTVTGSDRQESPTLRALASEGIEVWSGSQPSLIGAVDAVVVSSAVSETDTERIAAAERGIQVLGRADLLGAMTRSLSTIGVAGTHGKTTGTALLVTVMQALELDPSYIVGSPLMSTGTNGHKGEDELLILEADEAFGTFLELALDGLVITNVESDHLDHYQTVDALHSAFVTVASRIEGPVLACVDDTGAARVAADAGAIGYGTSPEASWRISKVGADEHGSTFTLTHGSHEYPVSFPRVGLHDVRNAAGVLALVGEMGHDVGLAARGLSRFGGVRRRFEDRGTVNGIRLVDDYAHHPTEVEAAIAAGRAGRPDRLITVFQPHLYSRTLEHLTGFATALASADEVVLTDIYAAREAPIEGVDGEDLHRAVSDLGGSSVYVPLRDDIAPYLAPKLKTGDTVLILGAGDINLVTDELLDLLGGM